MEDSAFESKTKEGDLFIYHEGKFKKLVGGAIVFADGQVSVSRDLVTFD